MGQKRVLVTGMSGLIGGIVQRELEDGYELRALNRSDVPGITCFQADIADMDAIQPAFEGVDTVLHLSAAVGAGISWEDALNTNIVGTYNAYEASRLAGVKRFIFASTVWVNDVGIVVTEHEMGYPYYLIAQGRYYEAPKPWPMITHETPVRPVDLYASTKVWGEALGRSYSDTHGLSVICLRIGATTKEDRPITTRRWPIWCSQRDLAQIVRKCVEAPDSIRYDTFYAVSNNTWGFHDFQHARQMLGYQPQDNAEQHR